VHILQITSGRDVNGALVYAKVLAERLAARGHRISMIARPNSWMAQQSLAFPLLTSGMQRFPPTELKRFVEFVRRENVDVIHTHMSRAHHFGIFLKLLTGVPVVATAHSRKFQIQWHFNDLVIANSHSTAEYLKSVNRMRANRIQTTHCFVELDRFLNVNPRHRQRLRRELHVTDQEFLIGVVGEIIPRKGQQYLIEALPQILAAIPQARVALIGRFNRDESYTRKLRGFQLQQHLFGRVKWLGRRANIEEYLKAFDLMVMPSLDEPLGLVAIESQAAGIPVVASNIGGLPEIVEHGRTGWLVAAKDSQSLATTIINAAKNPELRAAIVQTARTNVVEAFSPDRLTTEVEQAYERLLSRFARKVA
jgi:glycosyltransferase involved in cell wall biosynthesis